MGTWKALGIFADDRLAEMGNIVSAGVDELGIVKNVAVKVVLKAAV